MICMDDFASAIEQHKDLPVADQKKAGQPIAGPMGDEHEAFLEKIIGMLDRKEIDSWKPETLLKKDVYDTLNPEWQGKVDLTLVNLVDQLRIIEDYYRNDQTPNEAPQLQTMIEQLWQIKQRIEEHFDVFVI